MTSQHYEFLKSSPLFAFSLGSRELLHTNYLAWLFEQDNTFVEAILDVKVEEHSQVEVFREKHHLDIVVQIKTPSDAVLLLVIEIKVKDTPRAEQLAKYDKTLSEQFPASATKKFVFTLAPARGDIEKEKTGWKIVRFKEVSEKLKMAAAAKPLTQPSHKAILDEYIELLDNLHGVIEEVCVEDTEEQNGLRYWWVEPSKKLKDELKELRFDDTIKKLRASFLLDDILKELRSNHQNIWNLLPKDGGVSGKSEIEFDFKYGLTNKTPLVEIRFIRKTNKSELTIGIQIQGNQYRRYIEFSRLDLKRHSEQGDIQRFVTATDRYKWLLQPETENKTFMLDTPGGEKASFKTSIRANSPLCRYAPSFVYQYVNIKPEDPDCISPAELVSQILFDIELANQLITDSEYVKPYENWRSE